MSGAGKSAESGARGSSQFGEDVRLAAIFPGQTGCCLEVGAFDGLAGSATLAFERRGWRAILVEPVPQLAAAARANRRGPVFEAAAGPAEGLVRLEFSPDDPAVSGVAGNPFQDELLRLRGIKRTAIEVRQRPIDDMLAEAQVSTLDFATIDVEGFELAVLAGFDLRRWQPRIVILEDNSRGIDNRVNGEMRRRGYVRFATTGVNDWYARATDRELATRAALAAARLRSARARWRERLKAILPSGVKRLVRRGRP